MTVLAGTYDVTAWMANHTSQTISNVVIITDTTTTQDFTLNRIGGWDQIDLPPGCPDWTRFDGEYFPRTGLAYFMGGRSGTSTDGTIYSFNAATHHCTKTGVTMPTPISNYTIAALNDGNADLLCTFGGRDSAGNMIAAVQCYNPMKNSVTTKADLPAAFDTFLPGAVTVVDNKAYVFGGYRQSPNPFHTNVTYEYDPITNTYQARGNLTLARGYMDVTVVDGRIYAFGGDVYDGANLIPQTKTEVFTPGTGKWDDAAVAELPVASAEGRAFGFDIDSKYELTGKILIAGGRRGNSDSWEVVVYDIASKSYLYDFPELNIARRNQAGFSLPGGRLWIFGGFSDSLGYGGDTPPFAPPEFFNVKRLVYEIFYPIVGK
jgi:hypothetical protein